MSGKGQNRSMLRVISGVIAAVMLCTSVDVSVFALESDEIVEDVDKSAIHGEADEEDKDETSFIEFESNNEIVQISKEDINNDYSDKNFEIEKSEAIGKDESYENYPSFGGGRGTKDDPYIISSESHMILIPREPVAKEGEVLESRDTYYKLTTNLTLDDWTYVSDQNGHFDGGGHTIHNLNITWRKNKNSGDPALFGRMKSIKNLTIENAEVNADKIFGTVRGTTPVAVFADSVEDIENCCLKGDVFLKGDREAAGFCISVKNSIKNCTNYAHITIENGDDTDFLYSAGFCISCEHAENLTNKEGSSINSDGAADGFFYNAPQTMKKCNNYADINVNENAWDNFSNAAGMCLWANKKDTYNISDCHNYGNITSFKGKTTGFIVEISKETYIRNCSNEGSVTSLGEKNSEAAGIVINKRDNCSATIESCYNTGTIAAQEAAGIVNSSYGEIHIASCYNKGQIKTDNPNNYWGAAGGIVQYLDIGIPKNGEICSIENCYNAGNILFANEGEGGGLIRSLSISYMSDAPDELFVKISNCYNSISYKNFASDNVEIAGILGRLSTGDEDYIKNRLIVENCYCLDKGYNWVGTLNGIKKCTDAQMRKQSTYVGFDFNSVWAMGEKDYPYPILVGSGGDNAYVITFDPNGGTVSTTELTTNNNGIISSFPRPSFAGKRFMGWYTAAEGGERVSREYVFNADTTVYAHWGEYNEEDRVEIIPVNPAAGAKGVRYSDGYTMKLSISFETKSPVKNVDPSAGSFRIINKKTGKAIYETGANHTGLFHISSKDGVSIIEFTRNSGFEPLTEYSVEIEDGFLVFEDEKLYAYTDTDDWCFTTMEKVVLTEIELPNFGKKNIELKNDMFSQPAGLYSPALSELSACLSCMVYEYVDEDDANESDELRSEYYEHLRIAEQFQKLGFDAKVSEDDFVSKHFFADTKGRVDDEETRGKYSPSWIVHKTIDISGEDTDLFWVVIRGTYKAEWIDNFDPGTGDVHRGFNIATDYIKGNLDKYISDNRNPNNKMKILVTGHSRGAAVANLLGKKLDDERTSDKENIYVYTYASPNVAKNAETIKNKYNNIFNIVNPEDFVTKVLPRKWGYSRYGVTYVLPSRSIFINEDYPYKDYYEFLSDVQSRTRIYIGSGTKSSAKDYREYNPYNLGMAGITTYVSLLTRCVGSVGSYYSLPLSADIRIGHSKKSDMVYFESSLFSLFTKSLAYYMTKGKYKTKGMTNLLTAGGSTQWGLVGSETTVFFVYNGALTPQFGSAHTAETYMAMLDLVPVETLKKPKYYNEVRVSCPVDVTVKDKDGNVIGQVTDNNIIETTNELAMSVEGDSKSFFVHEGADYKIELTGNDAGKMDYTIIEYDADGGETGRTVYQDVPLNKGTTYTQDLSGVEDAGDAVLYDDRSKAVEKTLKIEGDELGKLKVVVNVEGDGCADSFESVSPGDYVLLTETPNIGSEFAGWFDKDGNLVSEDSQYSISVKESMEFTAKFKEVDGITALSIETQQYTGYALTPEVSLYDGTRQLIQGTDYTVSYKNNKNAYTFDDADKLTDAQKKSAPQAIVKMKGNYAGQKILYFCIEPLSIDDEAMFGVTVKKGKTPKVTFTYNGKTLKDKTDYTVDEMKDEAVTVTGKGNFTDTREFLIASDSTVTEIPMSKVTVESIPDQYYTGSALTKNSLKGKDGTSDYSIKVSYPRGVYLTEGVDYRVASILNPVNVGTATIVLRGLKAHGSTEEGTKYSFTGEKRINVKIKHGLINNAVITGKDGSETLTAVFNKSGARPEEINVIVNGLPLKENRDYTVKYTANTSYAGTGDVSEKDGKLTITGKGNFKGSRSVGFKITRRAFSEESGIMISAADRPEGKKAGDYATTVKVFDSEGKELKAGTDYEKEVKYYTADDNEAGAGTVTKSGDVLTVKVTGRGGYTADTMTASYRILGAGEINDISKATIKIDAVSLGKGRVTLTGDNAAKVHATIGKDKKALTFSTDGITGDFKVLPGSYVNNDRKGTAKVTFVGINGYSGAKTVNIKIGTRNLSDVWKGFLRLFK